MSIKSKLLVASLAITGIIAGLAHATPIVGLVFANILASGTANEELIQRVRVRLPSASGRSDDDHEVWTAKLTTSGPTSVLVQDADYAPGGHTGWHSHPGMLVSTVTEGSIEWYDSQCVRHVYNVGDALTEGTEPHYVRNVGVVNARFMITYILAGGQPRRIDQPAPACAAALGLD